MKVLFIGDKEDNDHIEAKTISDLLGYNVVFENSGERAILLYKEQKFDVIICAVFMYGMDCITLMETIRRLEAGDDVEFIIITAYPHNIDYLKLIRLGISDILLRPLDIRSLAVSLQRIEQKYGKRGQSLIEPQLNYKTRQGLRGNNSCMNLPVVGKVGFFSEHMQSNRDFALKLYENRTNTVLIEGETGTGKEIIARLIHHGNNGLDQPNIPFISINCSAISPNLFESELFGYEKGAFTGADPKGRTGKLQLATGGTLFLDEIGDMPLDFQPKLLRVLQEREFYRVTGNKKIKFDARIICASNDHLLKLVEQGKFRGDLYYRINMNNIKILPLRERTRDIVPLAQMFLDDLRSKDENQCLTFTEAAKDVLLRLPWQGNVRELYAVMSRIVMKYNDTLVRANYIENVIDENYKNESNTISFDLQAKELPLENVIAVLVKKIVKINGGNISKTAEYLRISRKRVKRYTEI